MKKLVRKALDNRNRIATAALVAGGTAMTTLASAQTADAINSAGLVQGATASITTVMSNGGPGIFGVVGLATGAIWLMNRVRSLG